MNKELLHEQDDWQELAAQEQLAAHGRPEQPVQTELPPTAPPEQRELPPAPEAGGLMIEEKEGFITETIDGLKRRLRQPKKKKPTTVPIVRDDITLRIEKIMEAGVRDAYRELTPVQQQEFKIKGEETALKIRDLLRATKIKVKKIFKLLLAWLKMLPGINIFFLEQEAKIKADQIIALKHFDKNKR